MAWRVGVGSGGTFTDVCLFDDGSDAIEVWKVSSTPDDPSRGIAAGIEEGVARVGAGVADVAYFGHGTTVGTNALIQHKGVRTGLITIDGFRDLLEIGRQKRPNLYDMQAEKAPVLVARDLRLEVPEPVRHDGTVETALDEEADVSVQAQILALFADLRTRLGIGMLLISHDLEVVRSLCDRVIVLYLGRTVEEGRAADVLERPRHPYTQVLLSASPSLDPARRRTRILLHGDPPSPSDPPSGCVFRTRCRLAVAACAAVVPPLEAIGPGHRAPCLRLQDT